MNLVPWIRGAAATAVVLTCAGLAQAQDFGVSPTEGAIGQEITLTSDGAFGARRGSVTLTLATGKRRRVPSARIVSWDADEIVFAIHKATAGPNFITVKPRARGAEALTESVGVEVLGPQLSGRNGNRFFKGAELVLMGTNFGTVRGKVTLAPNVDSKRGSRRPRVTSWTNDTINVKLPRLGPDGLYDITVTNFAGETSGMSPIELVTPPKPIRGKDRVVGRTGGRFSAIAGTRGDEVTYTLGEENSITIFGLDAAGGRGRTSIRNLTLVWDAGSPPGDIEVPRTYTGKEIDSILYTSSVTTRAGENATAYAWDDGPAEIRVNNVVGDRISGTFSATLAKSSGDGPDTLPVAGSFVATRTTSTE